MRAIKTIEKKFSGANVYARVTLEENLKPTSSLVNASGSSFTSVKGGDSDFGKITVCGNGLGTVYFSGLRDGEEWVEPVSCNGPYAVGSWKGKAIVFYCWQNELYYSQQSEDGSLNISTHVKLPEGEIVDLKLKELTDGIAVGVVLKYEDRYKFVFSQWNGMMSSFETLFTNNPTPLFAITGNGSNNLEITALGEYYQIFFYKQGYLENFRTSVEGITPKALATVEKDGTPYSYALYEKDGACYVANLKVSISGKVFYMNDLCRLDGANGLTASYSDNKTNLIVKTDNGIYRASFEDETKCDFLPVANATDMDFIFGREQDICSVKEYGEGPLLLSKVGASYNIATRHIIKRGRSHRCARSYCVDIEFRSKTGAMLCDEEVEVWSRSKLTIEKDGIQYVLKANKKLKLRIGKTGKFILRTETDSMIVPTIYVQLKTKMNESLAIDCAQCITETLKRVTASELKNARCRGGFLLPDSLRNSQSLLLDFTAQLNSLADIPPQKGSATFPDSANGTLVNVPQEYFIQSVEEGMIEIESMENRGNSFEFIIHFIQEGKKHAIKYIKNTYNDIVDCIKVYLYKFKIKFEQLFEWLAFLFEWDDIKPTALALERIMKEGLPQASGKIKKIKTEFTKNIKDMKAKFSDTLTKVSEKTNGKSLFTLGLETENKNPEYKTYAYSDSLTERVEKELYSYSFDDSPFPFSQVDNAAKTPIEILKNFSRNAEENTDIKNMEKTFASNIVDSDAVYSTPFSVLASALEKAVDFAVDGSVSMIGTVFDSYELVVNNLMSNGNVEIQLPFISSLYYEQFGEKLTMFKLVALLIALPITASYKAIADKPPFKSFSDANDAAEHVLRILSDDISSNNSIKGFKAFLTLAGGISDAFSYGLSAGVTIKDNDWATVMIMMADSISAICSFVASGCNTNIDVFDFATFALSMIFVVVDALVFMTERKYINNTEFGPILTCIMGVINMVLSLATMIVREDFGADTIVTFVMQCLNYISKIFLIGSPGLKRKLISVIMDIATGLASVYIAIFNAGKILINDYKEELNYEH